MNVQYFELESLPDLVLSQYRDLYAAPHVAATEALFRMFLLVPGEAGGFERLSIIYDVDPRRRGQRRTRTFLAVTTKDVPRGSLLGHDPFLRNFRSIEPPGFDFKEVPSLWKRQLPGIAGEEELLAPWVSAVSQDAPAPLTLDDLFGSLDCPLRFAVTLAPCDGEVQKSVLRATFNSQKRFESRSGRDRERDAFDALFKEMTSPMLSRYRVQAAAKDRAVAVTFLRSYALFVLQTNCFEVVETESVESRPELLVVVGMNEARKLLELPPFGVSVELKTFELETQKMGADAERLTVGTDTRFDAPVSVNVAHLTRHAFVTGMTGSGKTRTMVRLLSDLESRGIPWLVIEPAKSEYVGLLKERGVDVARYNPLRRDRGGHPVCINPFFCPAGTPDEALIGTLTDVLNAAFPVEQGSPLPYVIERALRSLLVGKANRARTRFRSLLQHCEAVVEESRYSADVTRDLQGFFKTRLSTMCEGAIGRIFNTGISFPAPHHLLQSTSVLELEGLSRERAALATLLVCVQLRQLLEALGAGTHEGLRFALVIEEAHRLVPANSSHGGASSFTAEYLGTLLAEVRSLGVGVFVVDQSAAAVARNVVVNTGLKVAHRIVNKDDREAMAASMLLEQGQEAELGALLPGQAWVFASEFTRPTYCDVRSEEPAPDPARPGSARGWLPPVKERAELLVSVHKGIGDFTYALGRASESGQLDQATLAGVRPRLAASTPPFQKVADDYAQATIAALTTT